MRTRLTVTVALGVLALGVAVALVQLRPETPEAPAPPARTTTRVLPGPSTPTPPPRGALSIRGRVVDAEGTPVAGIEVSATRAMPGESLSELPCDTESPALKLASSDCQGAATEVLMELIEVERGGAPVLAHVTTLADGTFQLDALPEGTVALWALGARGSAMKPDVATGADGVELVLEKGVSLPGRVVDESGAPLAGAKVTLFDHEGSRYFELRTDADGRFSFGPLPDVSFGLVASSPGLMPQYRPDVFEVELEDDIVLHAPRRLVGTVLAGKGAVAGARVRVQGTSHVTTTDAQGRFSIEPLAPDEYAVLGEHAGQHGVARVKLGKEPEAETTVYLGTLFFVEGTVRDEARSPVAGARVTVLIRGNMLDLPPALTAGDGRFRLGPLPPGRAQFQVESEQHLDLEHTEPDLLPSGPPLDLTLTSAVIVEGLVTDTEGRPLQEVDLSAELKQVPDTDKDEDEDEEADGEPLDVALAMDGDTTYASSDEAGRFRLKLGAPGRYVIDANVGGHVPVRLEADAPATGLLIALRGGATVEGTVVDARGEPLFEVDLRVRLGAGSSARELTTVSDPEGHFILDGLPPGTHTLEAALEVAGARHEASRTVEVRGPGTVRTSLRLDTGGSVSGLVVDEQGRPLPDAEVEAYVFGRVSAEHSGGVPSSTKTGLDGRFTVHHVPEGECLLRASKPGYALDTAVDEVQPGFHVATRAGARDVRLELRYQGSLSGRVVRADGAPLTGVRIEVNGDSEPLQGKDGAFRVPVERAGVQSVRVLTPDRVPVHREVEVPLGQDVDLGEVLLESGRRVSGRLVDAETSLPVTGATVQVRAEKKDSLTEDTSVLLDDETAMDGTFQFLGLEPRPMTMVVRHPGYVPLLQPLGAGDEVLELRLSRGALVEGTVKDREGRPVETNVQLTPLLRPTRESAALRNHPAPQHIPLLMSQLENQLVRVHSTGGRFSLRGLKPGEYAVEAAGEWRADGHPVRFLPQRVHIPAHGTVALAVTEMPGDATLHAMLKLDPIPEGLQRLQFGLLRGQVPPGETYDELVQRLSTEEIPSEYDVKVRAQVYAQLPAGRYTFVVLVRLDTEQYLAGLEEVDVPATGVIPHELRPVLRPVPESR